MQHSEKITLEELRTQIMEQVVRNVIPKEYFDANTVVHINPCGLFIIGGPMVIILCNDNDKRLFVNNLTFLRNFRVMPV